MARSFSVSGTGTVKTGTYGNPKNAGYIKVTGATFDESTGKIGINYEYGVYQTTVLENREVIDNGKNNF